jgi:hypothetical protein
MNTRPIAFATRLALALLVGGPAALSVAPARAGACDGIARCFDAGNFTADVVQVVTARQDGVTAYHTVRITLRLRNVSKEPLILAHRLGTNVLIDNNGNAYGYFNNRPNRVVGIGLVQPGSADTQFQLAPGEARNATFENVIQYSPARTVLGDAYNFDLVIEQLALIGGQQVRTVRSHAISFAGLTRGAAASAAAPAPAPGGPEAVVTTPSVAATPTSSPASAPAPQAAAPASDPCAPAPSRCFHAGPFVAQVGQLTVSNSGGATAYQTVRITLAIRNVSSQPLILGYKLGSHVLIDDRGNRYGYFNNRPQRVSGIGIVQPGSADAQFRLAPGQSRNATFESVHQYSVRRTVLGNTYDFDLVLVQLEPLSPTQVRSAREFALNFTGLKPMTASALPLPQAGALPQGDALPQANDNPVEAVQKAVDLFKSLTKPR